MPFRIPLTTAVAGAAMMAATLAAWSGHAPGGQRAPANPAIDAIFSSMDTPDVPGCAMAVGRDGIVVYARGYGSANLEYGVPITPSSVFHVASVSKQFTAASVALLAIEGRLSLDDDVRKHVPEVPDLGARITLRHLVHHTSGLRDQWDLLAMAGWRFESDVITNADVLDIVSRQRGVNFAPGAEYMYSNTGYTLLGIVVERVSGTSLRAFTAERIFGPLGMAGTHFHDDHQMVVKNRAYAYASTLGGGYRQSIPDFDTVGATSLFTTVEDLTRWSGNVWSRRVGGDELSAMQHQRGVLASGRQIPYALGLVHGEYRGLKVVSHGGADAGYRSYLMWFPDQRTSIAVLCGVPSSSPGQLAERVADVTLREVFTKPAQPTEPGPAVLTDAMRRLTGLYIDPASDQMTEFMVADGRLRAFGQVVVPDAAEGRFRTVNGVSTVDVLADSGPRPNLRLTDVNGRDVVLTPAEAATPDAAALDAYAGTFWSDELGTEYTIARDGERLVLTHRKIPRRALLPTAADRFRAATLALTFARDGAGRVSGFTISSGRVRKVRFDRVAPRRQVQ